MKSLSSPWSQQDRRDKSVEFLHFTGKTATMRTLACVIAAWEESTSTETWRNPSPWDTRIMTALTDWGYTASDVETLLTHPTTGPADNDGHDTPAGDTAA